MSNKLKRHFIYLFHIFSGQSYLFSRICKALPDIFNGPRSHSAPILDSLVTNTGVSMAQCSPSPNSCFHSTQLTAGHHVTTVLFWQVCWQERSLMMTPITDMTLTVLSTGVTGSTLNRVLTRPGKWWSILLITNISHRTRLHQARLQSNEQGLNRWRHNVVVLRDHSGQMLCDGKKTLMPS